MERTVPRGVPLRVDQDGSTPEYTKKLLHDVLDFLIEVKRALDQTGRFVRTSTSTDATVVDIWSAPVPEGRAWLVEARVVAITTAGTAARAAYIRRGLFYVSGGVAAQDGSTATEYTEESASAVAWGVGFAVTGASVVLQVQGDAGQTITWTAEVVVQETLT